MMVRAAVLKMKDPKQIIRDMEKLDEMGESEVPGVGLRQRFM